MLADIERAVGLHTGAGRRARFAKAGSEQPLDRATEGAGGDVHDVVENRRKLVVEARRRHQGDEPACRVEADTPERTGPVDGRELRDGPGVGAKDVDRGAERPRVHRGLATARDRYSESCHGPIHDSTGRRRVERLPRAAPRGPAGGAVSSLCKEPVAKPRDRSPSLGRRRSRGGLGEEPGRKRRDFTPGARVYGWLSASASGWKLTSCR